MNPSTLVNLFCRGSGAAPDKFLVSFYYYSSKRLECRLKARLLHRHLRSASRPTATASGRPPAAV
jgi:hypothetical protein